MKLNKKRGVLLVISLIILFSLILNTYSAPEDFGCCLRPGFYDICSSTTEQECCKDAEDYDYCKQVYFRPVEDIPQGTTCSQLEECSNIGCCYACCEQHSVQYYDGFNPDLQEFCETPWEGTQTSEAECIDRSKWEKETSCDETGPCKEACCICVTDYGFDKNTTKLTKEAECDYICRDYKGAYWNESITSLTECQQVNFTEEEEDEFEPEEFGKGNLTGVITTTEEEPISNADITLMTFAPGLIEATASTDEDGVYNITDIEQGKYILIASHPQYLSNQTSVTINETNLEPATDLTLQYRPTGTITGIVESDQGNVIPNALIFLNNTLAAQTNSFGEYNIITDPGNYSIYAKAPSHVSSIAYDIVVSENQPTSRDFNLEYISPGCFGPVGYLTANHISGEKGIILTWPSSDCKNLAGYYLFRNKSIIQYFDAPKSSYEDYDVEWGKTYQYSIKAVYVDNTGITNSTSTNSSPINVGDAECAGRYLSGEFTEFCDSHLRKICDDQNQVIILENCSLTEGEKFYCAGPDNRGETECKNMGNCYVKPQLATPFGLYYEQDTCTADGENYCYYDYSQTILDACYPCSQDMTCFDYESSGACTDDNCLVSNNSACGWIDNVPFSEMGKGLCYQIDYNGTDQCWRCSIGSNIFENMGCTQEVCSKLGDCYSGAFDQYCGQCSTCEALTNEEQCTGANKQSFEIDEDYQFTPSNDHCGLGKCKWNSSIQKCFKDGNDNEVIDCEDSDVVCQQDFIPPTTTLPQKTIILKQGDSLTFSSEQGSTLYYCIDSQNSCNPTNTREFNRDTLTLDSEDMEKHLKYRSGKYYIRFYSIDSHHNQEEIKSREIYADIDPPEIEVTYQINKKPEQSLSDIEFNIRLTEQAVCSDRLVHRDPSIFNSSQISEQSGTNWNPVYSDLPDGPYTYTVECVDFANNKKIINLDEIVLDASGYITINSPEPYSTTKETTVLFSVTTANTAGCDLYKEGGYSADFTPSNNGINHQVELSNIDTNQQHQSFSVVCGDSATGKEHKKWFTFTVDQQPPNTSITIHTEEIENPTKKKSGWELWFNNPVEITFDCEESLPDSFGCEHIRYCLEDSECNPDTIFGGQPVSIPETTHICYHSKDLGGNQEDTKCGIIHIGEALGIDLVNPLYNVSNIPVFDVEIETARPTVQCRFQGIPFLNSFESQNNEDFWFDKIGENRHIIEDFLGAQDQPYDMYIKCKDTAGFVNEDQPAYFKLIYDSTPPRITSLRTDPETVTHGNSVLLITETDDKAVCRYHPTELNYSDMRKFDQDWENGNPSFSKTSVQEIKIPSLNKTTRFNYIIACENRAGDISQTKNISFIVNYDQAGYIKSTSPSGSIKNESVILRAETSKPALCRYKDLEGEIIDLSTEDSINHFSTEPQNTTDEKVYTYTVTCTFSAIPPQTVSKNIQFTVDRTPPEMQNINDGDYSCGKEIYPQFEADDLSGIDYYNYSVYKFGSNNITLDWQTTSNSNPTISIDNLELGEKYYLKASAVDEPGNIGNEISSNGFIADDENSTACLRDQDPPEITLKKEVTYQGIKVTLLCEDETGCKQKYYSTSLNKTDCNATEPYSDYIYITETRFFCWKASDVVGNTATGTEKIIVNDSDIDGVPDQIDECPDTPAGESVDEKGCGSSQRFIDRDQDNVPDNIDNCLDTPIDEVELVDEFGCAPSQRDADEDGVIDDEDKCPGTPFGETVDTEGCSDSQKDSDDDGMDDAYEKRNNLDPFNSADAQQDTDEDGLTNLEEYDYYIDTGREISPRDEDTDDDGYSDKEEIEKGYNPTDAASKPEGKLFPWILIILGLILIISGSSYLTYMEVTQKPPKAAPPTKPPARPKPPTPKPQAPKPAPRKPTEAEKRRKELEKRREQIAEKRRKEKEKKRSKFFDIFSPKKKKTKKPKSTKEKPSKKPKPPKKPPIKKEEFERLNELTKEYKKGKKPLKSLLKIKKIPKGKKKEFEELKRLIKERPVPKKRKRELSPEKQKEVKDIFSKLSQLKKEVKTKKKSPKKSNHKNPLKELSKLNKKEKNKKKK